MTYFLNKLATKTALVCCDTLLLARSSKLISQSLFVIIGHKIFSWLKLFCALSPAAPEGYCPIYPHQLHRWKKSVLGCHLSAKRLNLLLRINATTYFCNLYSTMFCFNESASTIQFTEFLALFLYICHLRPARFTRVLCNEYIGWCDVTESMVMIRSPFCGYNAT